MGRREGAPAGVRACGESVRSHRVGPGNLLPIVKGHAPVSGGEPSQHEANPSAPPTPETPAGDGLCAPTWSRSDDSSYTREIRVGATKVLIIDKRTYGAEHYEEHTVIIDRKELEDALRLSSHSVEQ
jgi:hypothetical protein